MSDIDITSSGADGIERIVSSIDRLQSALSGLGNNSSGLDRLRTQMSDMQLSMTTGFAEIANIVKTRGAAVTSQIVADGEKAANAATEAGLKIKRADAATWEQIQRGSAANVSKAFNQLAQGIPVEAVRERLGQVATDTAASLDGQLAKLRQFQENSKSLYTTGFKGMAGATEADLAEAAALNQRFDMERLARQRTLGEEAAAASWRTYLELEAKKTAAAEARISRTRNLTEAADAASFQNFLDLEAKKLSVDEARISRTRNLTEAADAASFQNFLDLEAKKVAATERQRVLNTSFLTASPTSQLHTAQQAQTYAGLGGDATARYGGAAAAADVALLEAAVRRAGTAAVTSAAEHDVLTGAVRQVEGAFRGAAHEAGIYGMHHGQLIALLAGGGLAAAMHHLAETGAEVEYALASVNALAAQADRQPIDFDKFVGITSGTLNNLKGAAEGMAALGEAGMSQQEAFKALSDTMNLAAVGNMSVAQSAELGVEMMHAFGKSADELGNIGDTLVAVGAKANVSVHTLANDMKTAATTAELFGMSMQETTAAVGTLAERGLTIQPLSSALMRLYEPSAKAAKEMERIGLVTKDASGLRSFTQVMTDLAGILDKVKEPADELKNLGFSAQNIKGMEAMTEHLKEYKHLLEVADEAQGKMFDSMIVKEDTVEGAFLRLKSTLDGSFVKAFAEASPVIRQVAEDLMNMAGSDSTVAALVHLATGLARLTQLLVENAGVVVAAVAAYVGLQVVSSAATWVAAYTAAKEREAAATLAATQAARVATAQLSLLAVEEGAAAVGADALAAGMTVATTTAERLALGVKGVTATLGVIGIAVVAATSVYEIFRDTLSKTDAAALTTVNTINTTIDAYDREIDRLQKLDDQLMLTGETGVKAAGMVAMAMAQMARDDAAARLDEVNKSQPGKMQGRGFNGQNAAWESKQAEAKAALATADKLLADLDARTQHLAVISSDYTVDNAMAKLRAQIASFEQTVEPTAHTAEAKKAADLANQELATLRGQEVTEGNLVEMQKLALDVQKQIKQTKENVPQVSKGSNDELKAALELLEVRRKLAELEMQGVIARAKSQNKRGELGDFSLIDLETVTKIAKYNEDLAVAGEQREKARAAGKLALTQKYANEEAIARMKSDQAVQASAEAKQDVLMRMAEEEHRFDAQTLADQGKNQEAFEAAWEAQYRTTVNRTSMAIEEAHANGDTETEQRMQTFLNYLGKMRETGIQKNMFKDMQQGFGAAVEDMRQKIEALNLSSADGVGGVVRLFENATQAADIYKASLPALLAKQKELASVANNPLSTPDQKKAASADLIAIQKSAKEAKNLWVDVGKVIGDSLEKAFGRGGKAIGDLMLASAGVDARQEDISARYEKSAKNEQDLSDMQMASRASAAKGYGDMAQAAAGFFGTQSRGYQTLMAVSQAFHLAETALTLASLVPKGIAAILNQGTGDPYSAFARMAAMAAIVAGLGVAISGSFSSVASGASAAERQKTLGTGMNSDGTLGVGGLLGDPAGKSQSIQRSLDLVDKNTYEGLAVSHDMLASLRGIESSMAGLGTLVAQNLGLGTSFGQMTGSNDPLLGKGQGALIGAGAAAGAAIGSYFGPVGTLIGGLAGAAIAAVSRIKASVRDQGIAIQGGSLGQLTAEGVQGTSYSDINTKKSLLGVTYSNKNSRSSTDLPAEVEQQFTLVLNNLRAGISAAADAMDAGGADFISKLDKLGVTIPDISIKGLTGEEQQKALESAFSKLGDDLARGALGGLEKFQKVGEGYLETLARIGTDYQTLDVVFQSLGKTFSEVGMSSVAARERVIELSGGLSNFTQQGADFLKDFFSEDEQSAKLKARIAPTLQQYGLSADGPDMEKIFRDFVVGLDTTTEAGAQAYTQLMAVAPALKQVGDTAEKAATAEQDRQKTLQSQQQELQRQQQDLQAQLLDLQGDKTASLTLKRSAELVAMDASLRPMQQRIYALQDEASATQDQANAIEAAKSKASELLGDVDNAFSVLQKVVQREKDVLTKRHDAEIKLLTDRITLETQAVEKAKSLADVLKAAVAGVPLTRQQAQQQLKTMLATVQSGGALPETGPVQNVLAALGKDASDSFTTMEDYLRDQYKTANDIASLSGTATVTQTVAEQQLAATQAAKDAADTAYAQEVARLDGIMDSAQQQIDVLKGSATTLLSIDQAVGALGSAILNAQASPLATVAGSLTSAYQTSLGRNPEASALASAQNQVAGGAKISDITSSVANSNEAKVVSLYRDILHRDPDAEGRQFWLQALNDGVSFASVQAQIANSPEAIFGQFWGGVQSFDVGTNYVPQDMLAQIHKGERIVPAADNRMLLDYMANPSADTQAAMLAAILRQQDQLDRMHAMMEAHLYAIAKTSKDTSDFLEGAVNGDVPLSTKATA